MSIGERIAQARKKKGLTQEYLAWKTGVTVQAVSAWENDKNAPDRDHLIALSKVLDLSLDGLMSGIPGPELGQGRAYFDPERMYTFVKAKAQAAGLTQALAALPLMRKALEGKKIEGSDAPYCVRPLTMACHALAMGIADDDALAVVLLTDAVRLSRAPLIDLPVSENVRGALRLLSRGGAEGGENEGEYFAGIAKHPLASLAACMDRCCALSFPADGASREQLAECVRQTDTYVLPLLEALKEVPAWNDAAWLMRYHLTAVLGALRRLL